MRHNITPQEFAQQIKRYITHIDTSDYKYTMGSDNKEFKHYITDSSAGMSLYIRAISTDIEFDTSISLSREQLSAPSVPINLLSSGIPEYGITIPNFNPPLDNGLYLTQPGCIVLSILAKTLLTIKGQHSSHLAWVQYCPTLLNFQDNTTRQIIIHRYDYDNYAKRLEINEVQSILSDEIKTITEDIDLLNSNQYKYKWGEWATYPNCGLLEQGTTFGIENNYSDYWSFKNILGILPDVDFNTAFAEWMDNTTIDKAVESADLGVNYPNRYPINSKEYREHNNKLREAAAAIKKGAREEIEERKSIQSECTKQKLENKILSKKTLRETALAPTINTATETNMNKLTSDAADTIMKNEKIESIGGNTENFTKGTLLPSDTPGVPGMPNTLPGIEVPNPSGLDIPGKLPSSPLNSNSFGKLAKTPPIPKKSLMDKVEQGLSSAGESIMDKLSNTRNYISSLFDSESGDSEPPA